MSLKKITHCKIFPSFLKNSLKITKPFRTFWRRYTTNSRMKFQTAQGFLERQEKSQLTRPNLSARSPFVRERIFGEEKGEERPLPQHEPGHLALMPPLRPARRMSLFHQQNILNGNRVPSYSDVDSDTEDCTSALEKVRRMEESRKVHKKMLDLMQQQHELNQCMQDRQDLMRGVGSDGGTKQGVSRWASKTEEEEPDDEQPAPAEVPDVVRAGEIKGTRLGSLKSATALVAAEIHGQPSMYSQRSLQMLPGRPNNRGFRPDEEQHHRHIQRAYIPRNMVWPDYSASTSQLHKNAVTPPKGKVSYNLPRKNTDDYDSDTGDGIKESTKSVRPKVGTNTKPPMAMTNRPQDVFELHKARASEVEKRATEGLSKMSATSRVVGQNEPNRGKVFIKNHMRK